MKLLQLRRFALLALSLLSMAAHSELSANGSASYQDLGNKVFIGSLYLENPSQSSTAILDSNEQVKLQVVMIDRMSKRRWVNMWMQSIAINNPRAIFETQAASIVGLFDTFKGALITNDIFEVLYSPGKGTTISLNSTPLITTKDKDLFTLFLNAWIGSVPPNTQFKKLILGHGDSSALTASIAQASPTPERSATTNQWTISEEEMLAEEKRLLEEQQKAQLEQENLAKQAEQTAQAAEEEAVQAAEAKLAEAQAKLDAAKAAEEAKALSIRSLLAQQEYTNNAVRTIYKNIRYPKNAVKRNQQGTVKVTVVIARDGTIVSSDVTEGSGFSSLDKSALRAIKRIGKFDPLPETILDAPQELSIPISFRLAG